jgi:hypothetical protein
MDLDKYSAAELYKVAVEKAVVELFASGIKINNMQDFEKAIEEILLDTFKQKD